MSEKKFYLTTPIYYVNARPHIGHAYTTIVADVLARRHRLLGDETFFLTGTDEHGQKIERSAAAAGVPPQQFADQVSAQFRALWDRMGLTYNDYIRTTDPRHKRGVQKLFATLYERGFIYLAKYTGAYCVSDEAFVDAPVGTPCPDCGRLLEEVTEENFFFKLSEFQLPLLDLIESNTLVITPESRRNEVLSFLRGNFGPIFGELPKAWAGDKPMSVESIFEYAVANHGALKSSHGSYYLPGGLKDLSISRSSFTWGIPVPEPAASTAAQKHVIYVWLDALANYMTALGYGSDDETLFKKFWPADLHLVGKEIIRFHCVYWPAFLLAAELLLPKQITAHGWLLFDNSKMSKSKGNIVRTETILDAFGTLCPAPPASQSSSAPVTEPVILSEARSAQSKDPERSDAATDAGTFLATEPTAPTPQDLFASDVLRYFLLREIPFGQDGSFSFDALITRYNADLANGYGNLVSRVFKMIEQYFSGNVPPAPEIRALCKELLPEWWSSDPFGGDVSFNEEPKEDPSLQYRYIAIRDKSRQLGLSIDPELRAHGGRYFYTETEGLSIWEFFQVSIDPLLRAIQSETSPEDTGRLLTLAMSQIKVMDEFLTLSKPWKLLEGDHRRREILGVAAAFLRIVTVALYPILPYATSKVWAQLGLGDIELAASNGELKNLEWGGLQPGTKLGPLGPIFPRADKGLAQIMIDMENPEPQAEPAPVSTTDPAAPPRTTSLDEPSGVLTVGGSSAHTAGHEPTPSHTEIPASGIFANQPSTANTPQPGDQITIDDFAKIELRVAQILVAERIPKADKLLRLEVDLGPHGRRQILSGIAEWYTPEDLIGRRIVVITNLAPRKMRGLESHGMLLAASEGENGKPVLATFGEEIALGARLK